LGDARQDSAGKDFSSSNHPICCAAYGGSLQQLTSQLVVVRAVEECQQHAQRIKRGCLATQWDALGGIGAVTLTSLG